MKILLNTILLGFMFGFMACSSNNQEDQMSKISALNKNNKQYEINVENSIYSLGNNFRTKKVIEKLKNGEEIYIAAIGGSVTEGAGPRDKNGNELWQLGYAFKFRDFLQEKYPSAKIIFNGAGLSGTPSALGVIRYEKDILNQTGNKGQTPDIFIIEYSVNDGDECTKTRGFERLIRNVLEEKKDSMVIALYAHATYKNTQDSMIPVADFYKIPQVSIKNALEKEGANVDLSQEGEFFADYVHPTEAGHIFMADCLMKVFEKSDAAEEDNEFEVPSDYKNEKPFNNFKAVYSNSIDENIKISAGGFSAKDSNTQSIKKGGTEFPDNWYHSENSNSEIFKAELNCKNLLFSYKHQGSWLAEKFGNAEVFVDGKKFAVYDGNNDSKGWNDCVTVCLIDDDTSADHILEVKMAENSENLGFTILCLGYSK